MKFCWELMGGMGKPIKFAAGILFKWERKEDPWCIFFLLVGRSNVSGFKGNAISNPRRSKRDGDAQMDSRCCC